MTKADAVPLAFITAELALYGTISTQARQHMKGEETYNMDDPMLWRKVGMNSGIFGLLGNQMFSDHNGFNMKLIGVLGRSINAGIATADSILSELNQQFLNGDDNNLLADLAKEAKIFVPFQSAPAVGVAFERIVYDNLQRSLDPDYDAKLREKERKLRADHDIEFIGYGR